MLDHLSSICIFFLMFIVGANININDLKHLKPYKKTFVVTLVSQLVLLPLIAWFLILLTDPPTSVAAGLLIIALSPSGSISTLYSFVAKGNTLLSIAFTLLSCLLALVVLPILLAFLIPFWFDYEPDVLDLFITQSLHLLVFLVFPIVFGMFVSEAKPELINRLSPTLERISEVGLLVIPVLVFLMFKEQVLANITLLLPLAFSFVLLTLILAYTVSRYLGLNSEDEATLLLEFPVRNFGLTFIIAITVLNKVEYMPFIAVFFMVQTPIMYLLIYFYRRKHLALA